MHIPSKVLIILHRAIWFLVESASPETREKFTEMIKDHTAISYMSRQPLGWKKFRSKDKA